MTLEQLAINGHILKNGHLNGYSRHGTPSPETDYFKPYDKNHKGWIIQKFGGTSVGKFPVKIAEDIVRFVTILLFSKMNLAFRL